MKTAILYNCCAFNDEAVKRFYSIKKASDYLGYDLYFTVDLDQIPDPTSFSKDINFYGFTYKKYRQDFYHMVYEPNCKNVYQNCLPMAIFPFQRDNNQAYDYIWTVEYDVCCYGDWTDFFKRYRDSDADLITSAPSFKSYGEFPMWWAYDRVDKSAFGELLKEGCVCQGLMCCSRLSRSALGIIDDFYRKYNQNGFLFFEMGWPTAVAKSKGKIEKFDSNYFTFRPVLPKDFGDFKDGFLYHPVKLDINWDSIKAVAPK